ncbi:MAG: hypothetical protein US48_C0012G0009 [Candidatus Levybacteria bacterium GW2011_GWA2_37_36]|nr:MAG: hypothetical protein US43_C0019G0017 [Candidatus Levybacteria bacterium GW2011_GWA1_37_16]KKQ33732.1 MAG: hypothetical protein US48_C0012G0009 [Candidatus Levybacteria bacterium GW2011_GWA2_37_36]KKQ37203.1 MAG: hypothetical protein US55_C0038G0003 [Candidatus Levybacteria bacterium GW2011_GWC2_37_7]KKQ41784.1 MAG: hypothetical protein US59_C0022G0010 [Candidatus Levybacteria bacterium GW2011_GWB1_37_8]OGH49862.1 MAG: hypothetical protein A3H17_01480 [Candidatus Levybacteria bacterium R
MRKQHGSPCGEAGQILLIVILVAVVASTIGLSITSRSIISLRTSTEEAESQKALAAAEAGIERAMQGNIPIALSEQTVNNSGGGKNSAYFTKVDEVQSFSFLLNGESKTLDSAGNIAKVIPNTVPKDEGVDVWFIKHKDNGDLDYSDYFSASPQFLNLYWGSSSDGCGDAAIQAVIVTRAQSSPYEIKSYRYVYDGCSTRRTGEFGNNFTLANLGSFPQDYDDDGKIDMAFTNRTPINDLARGIVPASKKNIILMRVIPIYKDAAIGINTCNPDSAGDNCTSLPSQGYVITSTGTSGQAVRKLTIFKGYPQTYLPYLSYGLFVAN